MLAGRFTPHLRPVKVQKDLGLEAREWAQHSGGVTLTVQIGIWVPQGRSQLSS